MRIVLVGCRGAGKTAVGKIVARRLHLQFLDTDEIVEKAAGKTVSDIFCLRGEQYFRNTESKIIRSIKNRDNVVIAAGGGAPMRKSNVTNLKSGKTIIFYLSAAPETLYQRCENDFRTPTLRPALSRRTTSGLDEMRKILKVREPVYRAIADIDVDTSSSTPSQVANKIISIIKESTPECGSGFCSKQK